MFTEAKLDGMWGTKISCFVWMKPITEIKNFLIIHCTECNMQLVANFIHFPWVPSVIIIHLEQKFSKHWSCANIFLSFYQLNNCRLNLIQQEITTTTNMYEVKVYFSENYLHLAFWLLIRCMFLFPLKWKNTTLILQIWKKRNILHKQIVGWDGRERENILWCWLNIGLQNPKVFQF